MEINELEQIALAGDVDLQYKLGMMYEEENDTYRILLEFTAQSMWNEKFKIKINKLFEKLTELIGQAYVEEGSTNETAKVKAKNMISAIMGNNILKITSAGLKR